MLHGSLVWLVIMRYCTFRVITTAWGRHHFRVVVLVCAVVFRMPQPKPVEQALEPVERQHFAVSVLREYLPHVSLRCERRVGVTLRYDRGRHGAVATVDVGVYKQTHPYAQGAHLGATVEQAEHSVSVESLWNKIRYFGCKCVPYPLRFTYRITCEFQQAVLWIIYVIVIPI